VAAGAMAYQARFGPMTMVVSALFVYPVKSCRAISIERSALEARGLRYDRRWMIVDAAGRFITQRTEPRLALVVVALVGDWLALSATQVGPMSLPLAPRERAPRRRVGVWRDEVEAIDCGAEASDWISDYLGSRASLVYMPDDSLRAVNPAHARAGDVVSFADGYPLLLASTSSLDDLNGRLDRPVPMNRFRPNIVVSGSPPWAEDDWTQIRVADVPVRVVKPCRRCVITTTDQSTAERGVEPLRTLATFRTRGDEVHFAQNCIPEGTGTVAVGDRIREA
jgi:uncharacterized protein YcbX